MITAHFKTMLVRKFYILLIHSVNVVAPLCSLEINIGNVLVISHSLPKHLFLVMAHIDAMDMGTCVFTLHIVRKLHKVIIIRETGPRKDRQNQRQEEYSGCNSHYFIFAARR